MEAPQPSAEPQSLQTPIKKGKGRSGKKPKTALESPVTRFTRSQVESDWILHEMLVLVREIFAVDGDCLKSLSTYQKWNIISTNCLALDVVRSSNQCRRKWESMLADYKRIKEGECRGSHSHLGSYWSLSDDQKKEFQLPALFDKELFGSIDNLLKAQEARSDSDLDSETEGLLAKAETGTRKVETGTRNVVVHSGTKRETRGRPSKSKLEKEQEIIKKLCENSEAIHTILGENPPENVNGSSSDFGKSGKVQTDHKRRQGDELIRVLGSLLGTLNQFTELVKQGG